MNKLTIATVLSLLALPACNDTAPATNATPAAGALINAVPLDTTKIQVLEQKADTTTTIAPTTTIKTSIAPSQTIGPQGMQETAKPIAPVQPTAPLAPPGELGGARFGLRHVAGRTVVRLG